MSGVVATGELAPVLSAEAVGAVQPESEGPDTLDDAYAKVAREIPEFAGIAERDGKLSVLLTRPSLETARRARELLARLGQLPKRSPTVVTTEHADYGFGQLKDWYDRIASTVLTLPGVVMTDIDEARNRLYVGVADVRQAAAVRLTATRNGVPDRVLIVEQEEPVNPLTSLRTTHRPMVGGLQIHIQTNDPTIVSVCTLGFIAERSGNSGFVTNSHCTRTWGSDRQRPRWSGDLGPFCRG